MEIKIEDLKVLYSEEQLQTRIKELADEMNKFYNGEEVIAICVLKGAVMFATDLVKNLNMPSFIFSHTSVAFPSPSDRYIWS